MRMQTSSLVRCMMIHTQMKQSITVIATGLDSATATQPSVGKKDLLPEFGSYAESEKSAPSNVSPFQKRTAPQLRTTPAENSASGFGQTAHPGEQSPEEQDIQIPDFLRRR